MTREQAFIKAAKYAKLKQDWRYVVFEDGEYDSASDFDLESFWLGAPVIACFGPDGKREE